MALTKDPKAFVVSTSLHSIKKSFEILDTQRTPMGELTLRRRTLHSLGGLDVYEILLGEEYLMSSLFHAVEDALATRGLAVVEGEALDVVVGGLGLGYTAVATLACPRVRSLAVLEFQSAVIDWHTSGLLPLGKTLCEDSRVLLRCEDFFAWAAAAPQQLSAGEEKAKTTAELDLIAEIEGLSEPKPRS